MELKLQKDMNLGDHEKDGDEGREAGRKGRWMDNGGRNLRKFLRREIVKIPKKGKESLCT